MYRPARSFRGRRRRCARQPLRDIPAGVSGARRGERVWLPGLGDVGGRRRTAEGAGVRVAARPMVRTVSTGDSSEALRYAWSPTPEQVDRSRLRAFMTR